MITQEQVKALCGDRYHAEITAVLARNYALRRLNYELPKGTLVEITVYRDWTKGILYINGSVVDAYFPYDVVELLDTSI